MTALSIQPPYPVFTDTDGQPLEDGYVWIGAANLDPQTNPITVYWDAALTLPAAQPIRTTGGYPANAGTPARLYSSAADYSIRIQTKTGSLVFSAADDNGPLFGGTISSVDVTFLQAGTGAVERTAQAKMRDVVSVKDFGAVGDNTADDTTAVQAAINAVNAAGGGVVEFPGMCRVTSTINVLDNVVLRGEGRATGIHYDVSVVSSTAVNIADKDYAGVENMRVYGNGTANADVAKLIAITNGSTNCWVRGCFIDTGFLGVFVGDVSTTASSAVDIENNTISNIGLNGIAVNCLGNRINIANNTLRECGTLASLANVGAGIEYRGAQKGTITGNNLTDMQYGPLGACDGIRLEFATGSPGTQVIEVAVSGNVISNFSGFGIRGQFIKFCSITGNTIKGSLTNEAGIVLLGNNAVSVSSDYNTITGNSISGIIGGDGIRIQGDTAARCYSNTISGNDINLGAHGISISNGDSNLISGNTVVGATSVGFLHTSGPDNTVSGNKALGSAIGIKVDSGSNTTISGNTSSGNSLYGIFIAVGVTTTRLWANVLYSNAISNVIDNGTGTIEFDYIEGTWSPLFQIGGVTIATGSANSRYRKIGGFVYAQADFPNATFTLGANTGNATIAGLPYAGDDSGRNGLSLGSISGATPYSALTLNQIFHSVESGNTYITVFKDSAGLTDNVTHADMKALQAGVFYRVNVVYAI